MEEQRDTGLVLRTWPLRESDLIVSVLARERGKIRGVAHGALRPKGPWAGALDPLTEIELHFRAREGDELLSFRGDTTIVRSPYHPMPDLEVTWTLAFLAELVDETAAPQDVDDTLYRLIRASVDALVAGSPPRVVARHAESWVLRLHGLLPEHVDCAGCGASLEAEGGAWVSELHGIACAACARKGRERGPVLLPEDLDFLADARRTKPGDAKAPSPGSLRRLGVFLGRLLQEFLGRELKSERFLAELDRLEG